MTAHEQQSLDDSPDQAAANPVTEAPGIEEESLPAAPDPALTADTTERGADAVEAGPSARREASADELLFADDDLADLRGRWAGVQAAFVDNPKDCVQKADVLVSDLVEQLANGFARARSRLEEQWSRGEEASTEDLRLALMHYREFFERLLAV